MRELSAGPRINKRTSLDVVPKLPIREFISTHLFRERLIKGYVERDEKIKALDLRFIQRREW
jgi:hypothetical protein